MTRYALISVSDKTDLIALAQKLIAHGYTLLSTGGSYQAIIGENLPCTEVSAYTGLQEMMDGRVKTLHPKIHGGILGRRGIDDAVMASLDIGAIDVVVVNLYPFAQTIAKDDATLADAIANIDIGGPAMIRSAAKNHAHVAVFTDPADYALIDELHKNRAQALREYLAQKAFAHTAYYDSLIAKYLGEQFSQNPFEIQSNTLTLGFQKVYDLRYGENPHQRASFYQDGQGFANATQIQGKPLSFNNLNDADTAHALCSELSHLGNACVIVKHANPCGVAIGDSLVSAYERALACDPESAFGGIIALSSKIDMPTAQKIAPLFAEVIIAPAIDDDAKTILAQKKNLRVLIMPNTRPCQKDYKRILGGLLVQDGDNLAVQKDNLRVVSASIPDDLDDLLFAWTVAKYVKSNAIVYAKNKQTLGIGAGQMSRVNSARIGVDKAKQANLDLTGAVLASDAFFPFRDGIDNAAAAGVKAIIQPGGSVRDDECINAANEHGIAMVFTDVRHFRH